MGLHGFTCSPVLRKCASEVAKGTARQAGQHRSAKRALMAEQLATPGSTRAFKLFAPPGPSASPFLEQAGTIFSDPEQVDRIAREAWGGIYRGNHENRWTDAFQFMQAHGKDAFESPEWSVPEITGPMLLQSLQHTKATAPGPDAWALHELILLSPLAIQHLATMLNRIEQGASWPAQMCEARAALLAKTHTASASVMQYRSLTIASIVYRAWGKLRLRHLAPWIAAWSLPELVGGAGAISAGEASWQMALDLEVALAEGSQASALATDIFKCFDQLSRHVVLLLAAKAGAPAGVTLAWFKFLEGLKVRNSMALAIGELFERPASVPQGCPLSMMWLCLLMRHLVIKPRMHACTARVLADDLICYATGPGQFKAIRSAGNTTHDYLHSVGCVVAHAKTPYFRPALPPEDACG